MTSSIKVAKAWWFVLVLWRHTCLVIANFFLLVSLLPFILCLIIVNDKLLLMDGHGTNCPRFDLRLLSYIWKALIILYLSRNSLVEHACTITFLSVYWIVVHILMLLFKDVRIIHLHRLIAKLIVNICLLIIDNQLESCNRVLSFDCWKLVVIIKEIIIWIVILNARIVMDSLIGHLQALSYWYLILTVIRNAEI